MKKTILLISILLFTILTGCASNQGAQTVSQTRFLLNTACTITIHNLPDDLDANDIINNAFDLIAEYEALFSMTDNNSDIWRINHAGGAPVRVSLHTMLLIREAIRYGELADGFFDITIGRLSTLWELSMPSENDITIARETVDFRQIEVIDDTIRLINPDAWIDLGGIAKGYIADRVTDFLLMSGVERAIVDLGGDIVTIGVREHIHAEPWNIGVREPFGGSGSNELFGVIETGAAAITTAGTYERYFEHNNTRYHQIIDPFTGRPVISDIVSATVLARDCLTSDALSTIAILLGSERAQGLLQNTHRFIGALLILENGEYITFGNINFVKN